MWTRVLVMVVLASACSKKEDKAAPPPVTTNAPARLDLGVLNTKLDALVDSGDNVAALEVSALLVKEVRSTQPGSLLLARVLLRHGMLQRYTGDWKGARTTLEEAAAIPALKSEDEQSRLVQFELGAIYMELHETEKSIAALKSSIVLAIKHHGADSAEVLDAKETLASTYDYAERYVEAEKLFRELLAVTEKTNDAEDIGRLLTNLGINLKFQERDQEALELYLRALGVLAKDSAMRAEVYAGMGGVYTRLKRPEKALVALQTALDLRLAELGPEHPVVAMDYHNLAIALDDLHQLAKAREACGKSLAIRQVKLPADHPYRIGTENLCAELAAKKK